MLGNYPISYVLATALLVTPSHRKRCRGRRLRRPLQRLREECNRDESLATTVTSNVTAWRNATYTDKPIGKEYVFVI